MRQIKELCLCLASVCLLASASEAKQAAERDYCASIRVNLDRGESSKHEGEPKSDDTQARSLELMLKPDPELTNAWNHVNGDKPCESRSMEYVSILASCKANQFEQLTMMRDALRKYSAKCLTPAFWDKQLWQLLAGRDKSGLKKFMSSAFLEQYHRENPNDPPLHFGTIEGLNCCKPWRSFGAVFTALAPVLGGAKAVERVAADQKKLRELMKKHLFEPCQKYIEIVGDVMAHASAAADYHEPGGQQAFIESLSNEFQEAIFRYKYCDSFIFMTQSQEKISSISARPK